ncbi:MAG: competence protein ComEA [Oceanicoccus sp.]|jgi:competence protein ComEA
MRFLSYVFFCVCLSLPAANLWALDTVAVNINTADAATLSDQLKGVGHSKAEAIVAYRESYGPFKSIDELTAVKGIGESLMDKNRERIVLE